MGQAPLRILVCHEDSYVRLGVRTALRREVDCQIAGEAGDARQAVLLAQSARPDVALVQVSLPPDGGGGLELMGQLARPGAPASPVRVLAIGGAVDEGRVLEMIAAGASGFVRSDAPIARLSESVRIVAAGDGVLPPAATRKVIEWLAPRLPLSSARQIGEARLTDREQEVLQLLADGRSGREIARQLGVAETTYRSHVHNILGKLGARDRAQAIVYAFRRGLLY